MSTLVVNVHPSTAYERGVGKAPPDEPLKERNGANAYCDILESGRDPALDRGCDE
jgi:hypothetical protein